jgi:hypothetical protein
MWWLIKAALMGTGAWTGWNALDKATGGGAGTVAKSAINIAKSVAGKAFEGTAAVGNGADNNSGNGADNNPGFVLDDPDSWTNLAKKLGTDFGPGALAATLTYIFGPSDNTYIKLAMGVAAACAVYYVQHSLLKMNYNDAAANPEPAKPEAHAKLNLGQEELVPTGP